MSSLGQKVAVNATALTVGRLLQSAVGVVSVAVSARYLGLEGFGALVTATAFVTLSGSLTDLGLSTVGMRELARRPLETDRIVGSLLVLAFILSTSTLLFGLLIMSIVFAGPENFHEREAVAVLLLMAWPLAAPATVIGCYFNSQQRAYLGTLASVSASVVTVVLLVVVSQLDLGFLGMVVAYGATAASFGIAMLALSFGRIRLRPSLDLAHGWQLFRWALPMGGTVIVSTIYWKVDIVLLDQLGSTADVAFYGIAYKVIDAVGVLPTYMTITLLPEFVRLLAQPERLNAVMSKAFGLMQIVATPVLVITLVFADEITKTVGGTAYGESATLLRILMLGIALGFLSTVLAQGIIAFNRQRLLFYATLVTLAINVALNVAFIPIWGARGSAWAFVLTEVCLLTFLLVLYGRLAKLPTLPRFFRVLLAGCLMASAGLVRLVPTDTELGAALTVAVGASVAGAIYVACLYALKAMPREVHTTIVLPIWTRLRRRSAR